MYIFLTVWQTDTASVLMEAIGYINFLQDQVEVVLTNILLVNREQFFKTN